MADTTVARRSLREFPHIASFYASRADAEVDGAASGRDLADELTRGLAPWARAAVVDSFLPRAAAVLVAAVLAVGALAAPARAHFIPRGDAESRWFYVFNHKCGDGLRWNTCADRRFGTHTPNAYGTGGWHSWYVTYTFREADNFLNKRTCQIGGRLEHTTVASWSEACW